jgi:hypothetical protein
MASGRFESTEPLLLETEPFIDKTTGDRIESGDTVTYSYTRPDASTSSGAGVQDATTKLWHFTLAVGGNYQSGVWYFRITSSNANTRPQYASVYWGTGSTEDVRLIKAKTDNLPASPANETTVAAVKAKTDNLPATPADQATSLLIKAKTDLLPASPAATSDVTTAAAAILALLGTPEGASLAADIKNLRKILKNNWVITAPGILTIFDDNDSDILFQFNLLDINGAATTENARQRVHV